jgi:hypothetical protein
MKRFISRVFLYEYIVGTHGSCVRTTEGSPNVGTLGSSVRKTNKKTNSIPKGGGGFIVPLS